MGSVVSIHPATSVKYLEVNLGIIDYFQKVLDVWSTNLADVS